MKRLAAMVVTSVCAVLSASGCSKTPEKLYPVSGVVTVGDKTLNGGTVLFEMVEVGSSGKVYTSSGEINADGSYDLITFGELGARAGEHRVWVTPNLLLMPDKIGVGINRTSPVPKKYMLPTTTDLSFTVTEGDNRIDVNVPKK